MSPTQRSLKLLRDQGHTAQVVEKWNAFAKRRIDLFGVIDIVAIHPDAIGCKGIQTTSGSNMSARIAKAMAEPTLKTWLKTGNSFVIHGWRTIKDGNRRKMMPIVVKFTCKDDTVAYFHVSGV